MCARQPRVILSLYRSSGRISWQSSACSSISHHCDIRCGPLLRPRPLSHLMPQPHSGHGVKRLMPTAAPTATLEEDFFQANLRPKNDIHRELASEGVESLFRNHIALGTSMEHELEGSNLLIDAPIQHDFGMIHLICEECWLRPLAANDQPSNY